MVRTGTLGVPVSNMSALPLIPDRSPTNPGIGLPAGLGMSTFSLPEKNPERETKMFCSEPGILEIAGTATLHRHALVQAPGL